MKPNLLTAALLSAGLSLAFVPAAHATTYPDLVYYVKLNLSSLAGNANGPYSLDFQLATGSGNVTNTVTLSNFQYVGGGVTGTPNYTAGGESGSLATSLVLTDSSLNNEFAEALTAGVTQLSFKVDETPNSEVVSSGTPIPEQFNVFLDDSTGYSIPTTDSSGGTLVESDLGSSSTLATVETFTSTSPDAGVTASVSASAPVLTPEPASTSLLLLGAGGVLGFLGLRRRLGNA
jgi:hypothetical protein